MLSKELNRDVKRLVKAIQKEVKENAGYIKGDSFPIFQKEFRRLYHADDMFEFMSKDSILRMLRLNLKYRFMPLYLFGIKIQLNNI
jgi:hypothetical protein